MYEALVARVRYHIQKANFMGLKEAESTLLLAEAADAIENTSKAYQMMAEAYEAEATKPRWIPVAERLPYSGDKVIVAIRDESGDTRFDFTNTGWWSGYGYKFVVEDEFCSWVTHWMPLPEPPEEES